MNKETFAPGEEPTTKLTAFDMGIQQKTDDNIVIRQFSKDLYSAKFSIIIKNEIVGHILFQGQVGSMEGNFQINYKNDIYNIEPVSHREVKRDMKQLISYSPFRAYKIKGRNDGYIWQDKKKISVFQALAYRVLYFNNENYYHYVIGFGEKGIRGPVYNSNNIFIGEIDKESITYDDLHTFNIKTDTDDDNKILSMIILACYQWVYEYYKAGQKYVGIHKEIYITKDKELLKMIKG